MHSQTKNPEEITRQADIIIAAVGVANLVRGNWIKPGAAIIDVGINPVDVRHPFHKLLVAYCYFMLFLSFSCLSRSFWVSSQIYPCAWGT